MVHRPCVSTRKNRDESKLLLGMNKMGHFKVKEKDLFFILKDQLNYGSLCDLERYRELDPDTLDMLVQEAIKFSKGVVDPLQEIGEKWGVIF